MTRLALVCLVLSVAVPATALTGREVIDSAQQKNGFSTWKNRLLDATMRTYAGTVSRSYSCPTWPGVVVSGPSTL